MIIVIIICAILYLIMVYGVLYLYYTYNKDYNDLEYRILQLEKRVPSKVYKDLSKEDLQELRERWENDYFHWISKPEYVDIDTLPNGKIGIKVKKNNNKGVSDMACKKGRGGRGGRKK